MLCSVNTRFTCGARRRQQAARAGERGANSVAHYDVILGNHFQSKHGGKLGVGEVQRAEERGGADGGSEQLWTKQADKEHAAG